MTLPPDDASSADDTAPSTSPLEVGSVFNRQDNPYERPWLFREQEALAQLPAIEEMIRALPRLPTFARTLQDDFSPRTMRHGRMRGPTFWRVKKDSRLQQCQLIGRTLADLQHRRHHLSLHAQAFLEHLHWCDVELSSRHITDFTLSDAEAISQQLKASIDTLVKEIASPPFKRKVKEVDAVAKNRASSLRTWMRAAFRQAPHLLWVQLHLGHHAQPYEDVQQTIAQRQAFLANRQNKQLFHHLVGYVSKLHYYPTKGLIHDMILLYDAHHVRELVSVTQALKQRWEDVTEHQGMAWVEGEPIHPKAPRINGIWSLETQEDRQRLKKLITYLSDYDTYLHYQLPPHTRTLVMSQRPGKTRATKKKPASGLLVKRTR